MCPYFRLELLYIAIRTNYEDFHNDETLRDYFIKNDLPLDKVDMETQINRGLVHILAKLDFLKETTILPLEIANVLEKPINKIFKDNYPFPTKQDYINYSSLICSIGNKFNDHIPNTGFELATSVFDRVQNLVTKLSNIEGDSINVVIKYLYRIKHSLKLLELVNDFVIEHRAMLNGSKPYSNVELENVTIPEEDEFLDVTEPFEPNIEESVLDDSIKLLEGVEDYLNGNTTTEAYRFLEGVALANSVHLVTGQEGPIFDSIRDMGRKALDMVRDSFNSFLKSFEEKDPDTKLKELIEVAENNKKALQKADNPQAPIKEASANGLENILSNKDLEATIGNPNVTIRVNKDGLGAIDKLLGYATKLVREGYSKVNKVSNETKASIKNLEDSIRNAGRGDEENKDVVKDNKEAVTKSIAEAKEKLKEVRAEESKFASSFNTLAKAIKGITPAIFTTKEEED